MYDVRFIYTSFGWSLLGFGASLGTALGAAAIGLAIAFSLLMTFSIIEAT